MKTLLARYQASHLGRMVTRYGERGGALLAGGTAYAALFSVFGALAAGFAVAGLLLGNHEALLDELVKATAEALPGLLTVDGQKGAIDPEQLLKSPSLFSVAGIVGFVVALVAGLGWVDALRIAIRTLFDLAPDARNIVLTKLTDVLWLACLGGLLVASAVLSMGLTAVGGTVLDWLGLDGALSRALLRVGTVVIVVLVNAVTLIVTFRWLAGLHLPLVRLARPVLVGGIALTILTQFSGVFVGSAGTRNPLLATGAVLVTLLVLFNLISRVMLYVAAWLATEDAPLPVHGPQPELDLAKHPTPQEQLVLVAPSTYDRTLLSAGAVLGAAAVLGVRVVVGALGSFGALVGRR